MQLRDQKSIIRNLYQKHMEVVDNIVYADKLFVINTVINFLFKDKSYKDIDQFQIARYGEVINKFLHDQVDIFWQDGTLMVRDLENGEQFEGG